MPKPGFERCRSTHGPWRRDRIRAANRWKSPPQFNHFLQPPQLERIIVRENAGDPTILDRQSDCSACAIEVASDAWHPVEPDGGRHETLDLRQTNQQRPQLPGAG